MAELIAVNPQVQVFAILNNARNSNLKKKNDCGAKLRATSKQTETFIDERGYDPELEAMMGDIRNKPWSEDDKATLKRYYGKVKTEFIVKKLGRTPASIGSKVRELGLKFVKGE